MTDRVAERAFESRSIAEFTENAYLNYAMYVIMDRALPHIADGLKPVQRRIVYAMSELGLKSSSKPKKSARTVGDVLGKFHPHGDTACYEAMVLMAQPFSYRHPLVEGQGNWGSPDDPKSFAAMRYTEAKLSAYSDVLLAELGQGTTDWQDNFDGSLKEPVVLPARLPNILLNGTTGIAVGMATDIPSHNLREVVQGAIALLQQDDMSDEALMQYIPGPDLPTRAFIITPKEELLKIQQTGRGSYRMRARYTQEKGTIVIDALPHQVSGTKIQTQIAEQITAKKLPFITDIRDESDAEQPTRIVLILKGGRVDVDAVMRHLFATTDLESSYRVNMNMIGLDGRPQVKALKEILVEWLHYRRQIIKRRIQYNLDKIERRLHILAGLLIAYLNIDEVIQIIREEDHPKPVLMQRFAITDVQAEAILELKLRHLAKLEEMEIRREQEELLTEQRRLQEQLDRPEVLTGLMVKELEQDALKYGNDRQSPIQTDVDAAVELKEEDITPAETITVVLSQSGWVRAAKGADIDPTALSYRTGDGYLSSAVGKSNQRVLFLDTMGRSYGISASQLPSARGQGEPITSKIAPTQGAHICQVLMGKLEDRYLMAGSRGYGFITQLQHLDTSMKAGKALLTLGVDEKPLPMLGVENLDQLLAILTSGGRLLIYGVDQLPELAKGKGNKLISIDQQESITAMAVLSAQDHVQVFSGARTLTLKTVDIEHYTGKRGQRGHLLPRGFQKAERLEVLPLPVRS